MGPSASGGHNRRHSRAGSAGRGLPLPLRPRVQGVAPRPDRPRLPPPPPAGGRPVLPHRVPRPAQPAQRRRVDEGRQHLHEPRAGFRPNAGIRPR